MTFMLQDFFEIGIWIIIRCQDISPRGHFTPGHLTPIWKVALIDAYINIHGEL